MAALEVFLWFLYTLTTMVIAVVTFIYTILYDVPWIVPATNMAFNIIIGVLAYCIGRQASKREFLKQEWAASIHTKWESRPTTLNMVVQVAEPLQKVSITGPKLVEPVNVLNAENIDNESKEQIARVQHPITIIPTEHLGSENRQNHPLASPPVFTPAEKAEKLKALNIEKRLLRDNEEEEEFDNSELFRLYVEAADDWTQAGTGEDKEALKKLYNTAQRNWSMARKQERRKEQRLKRIDLDIKALSI